jgi:adenine phosphoribosyltransferase
MQGPQVTGSWEGIMKEIDLRDYIRDVPDFPKPGIVFKDITPLLSDPKAFSYSIDQLYERYSDQRIDAIVAAESRGFIFGAPLAIKLSTAFVPVRKPGKLPYDTHSHSYDLEYGSDTLEIHSDALSLGHRVLIVDDLLATGGTLEACIRLIEKFDVQIVECAFCIHLRFLAGEERLKPHPTYSLIEY